MLNNASGGVFLGEYFLQELEEVIYHQDSPTNQEIADWVGMTATGIWRIREGNVQNIRISTFFALYNYMKCHGSLNHITAYYRQVDCSPSGLDYVTPK